MKFQLAQNDENDRGEEDQMKLKNTIISIWLGMRDDYRTLIGMEGVNVVNKSDDLNEEKGDE